MEHWVGKFYKFIKICNIGIMQRGKSTQRGGLGDQRTRGGGSQILGWSISGYQSLVERERFTVSQVRGHGDFEEI